VPINTPINQSQSRIQKAREQEIIQTIFGKKERKSTTDEISGE
jgi:hypothetical protein